jgi:predicted 2-oxoglutarate/Fe(II)-dependent dioxygenase YbiX
MIKDLRHYVHVQQQYFPKELMDKTVSEMKSIEWQTHTFYNPNKEEFKTRSGEQELSVSWSDNVSTKNDITKGLWKAIKNYQKRLNFVWFDSWQGYSAVRFNKYETNTKMALHKDHIHSLFDGDKKGIPILSILIALNDNYDGGEFVLFDDYEIKLKTGDVLIFPSVFLYPHKVEPVKTGTRYTAISWTW